MSPRRIEPLAGTGKRIRVSLLAKLPKTAQNYLTQVLNNVKQRQTILPETERMLITKLRKITVASPADYFGGTKLKFYRDLFCLTNL